MASAQNQKITASPLLAFVKTHMVRGEASAGAMHRHAIPALFNLVPADTGHTVFSGITGAGKSIFMQETLHHILNCGRGNNERFLD